MEIILLMNGTTRIRNVVELIEENGLIYEFQKLKQSYDIPGTYLDHIRLINKIPRRWRDMINEDSRKNASHRYDVQVNCYVFYLLRNRRGCRDIYDKIVPVNEIIIPNKWINEIGDISVDEWKKFNKNLNYIKEVKLRDFQYKFNNRILVTNTFLFKIKNKRKQSMFILQSRSRKYHAFAFSLWES